jgi:hypothetical protein
VRVAREGGGLKTLLLQSITVSADIPGLFCQRGTGFARHSLLREVREGWGIASIVYASEIKSLGHPTAQTPDQQFSVRDQGLQGNAVGDHKRRAVLLDKTLLPEIREKPGDGLSRKSDHLRDFLVGESELQPGVRFDAIVLGSPFQKQFRQFLGGRV